MTAVAAPRVDDLVAHVQVDRGDFSLDVSVRAVGGETVAVLGPNGAGKSTLLGVLAGLVAPTGGRVVVAGAVVDDVAGGIRVPPEQRSVGYVFQDHLLFPHLTALDNVAFGLRARRRSRAVARRVAGEWLERLGVADRASARPRDLSGGQAQRVALARALAVEPAVLLLDEPLAALDVMTRDRVRSELRTHLASLRGPRLLVTHDPLEAAVLGDRVVVVEDGAVTHEGTLADLTRHPRSPYVARLVGRNLYRGTAADGVLVVDGGGTLAGTAEVPVAGPAVATIRPQAASLHRIHPEGTPRNVWPGRIAGLDIAGDRVRVEVTGTPPVVSEITPAALAALGLTHGDEVWVAVKATEVMIDPL